MGKHKNNARSTSRKVAFIDVQGWLYALPLAVRTYYPINWQCVLSTVVDATIYGISSRGTRFLYIP